MKDIKDYLKQDCFANHIGAAISQVNDGYATATMVVQHQHLNAHGMCQGGALFALADLAFAAAVNSHAISTLTTSANITYVKPARLGEQLCAEARELVNHHRMPFAEVHITNRHGDLIAIFTASGYRKENATSTPPQTNGET